MKPASLLATILLSLIAVAHLFRLVLGLEVAVAGRAIPSWASVLGCVVPAAIAVMLWRESRR